MPASSFSLVFDSESAESTQEIFDLVKLDAQLQDAVIQKLKQENAYTSHWELVEPFPYYSRSLPVVVKSIINGTSIIRFDAVMSEWWDLFEQLPRGWKIPPGYMFNIWACEYIPRPGSLSTEPPMPKWIDVQLNYILPESRHLGIRKRPLDDP
jgi:hypothetical protein